MLFLIDKHRVNMDFVKVIMQHYETGDFIWIHDFQLLLLPKMIRERCPNASIGFFLHTPFPSSEVYRMLPNRRELMEGMLGRKGLLILALYLS